MDTETGGLDSRKYSILQIGSCIGELETGEILNKYEELVKLPKITDYVVDAKALAINKLTIQQCFKNGISPEEIVENLMDQWVTYNPSLTAFHNSHFDIGFIMRGLFKQDPENFASHFTYRIMDSLPLMRILDGHNDIPSGASLTKACAALNIDMSDIKGKFHGALFDSIACFRFLAKFRQLIKNIPLK